MKGELLDYSSESFQGIISGDDGSRYYFLRDEWKSSAHPLPGTRVDFEVQGKTALGVYIDKKSMLAMSAKDEGHRERAVDERYNSLYCSSDDRFILGFSGGLAHKFGLPSAAMRFLVFFSFFFVIGWFYFLGIFLPKLPTKNIPRNPQH